MSVKLDKVGNYVKLSVTEPTCNLTEKEVETLKAFVQMAVDMLLPFVSSLNSFD